MPWGWPRGWTGSPWPGAGGRAEQRLQRLLDGRFSGLPDQLSPDPGPVTGLVLVQKRAVGALAEARRLAAPASVGLADTSLAACLEELVAPVTHDRPLGPDLDRLIGTLERDELPVP